MSSPTLPSHIKTVLITGASGFLGRLLSRHLLQAYPKLVVIATDIVQPPSQDGVSDDRLIRTKADLGKREEVEGLFAKRDVQGVFALHGIMSGQSESDFTLGYAVNLYSHLTLIDVFTKHTRSSVEDGKLPVYVNVSSLAVYGGEKATPRSLVKPDETPLIPETSYGVCKHAIEMIVYDHARKGYLDARTVRLPTVCIRTGAPSSAASSFISSLIREPLQSLDTVCPIADSPSDPIIDEMWVYVTRVKTVVSNIARAITVSDENIVKEVGKARIINLPGIKINTRQILVALEKYGGDKALSHVSFRRDSAVIAICETWAGDYEADNILRLGFEVDSRETGYDDAVKDFVEDLKQAK